MFSTTTSATEGHPIKQHLGIVTDETVIGADAIKDFIAGLTGFLDGRLTTYEKVLIEGKEAALKELQQHTIALGASTIVGIDLDYEAVGANRDMLTAIASGTAVQV